MVGTLLGTGGLVKAYSDVSKLALEKSSKAEMFLASRYQLKIPYNDFNIVQRYCSINCFTITESSFSDTVTLSIVVKNAVKEKFTKELVEILEGKVNIIEEKEQIYI